MTASSAGTGEHQSITINLKALLLMVVLTCAGLLLLSMVKQKRQNVIPAIKREALRPLTPAFTVDRIEIITELKASEFKKLDAQLSEYQERAENDPAQESNAWLALEALRNDNPALDPRVAEWVRESPDSYSAHLVMAMRSFDRGWAERGGKWAADTSERQFEEMKKYFDQGVEEAQAALSVNPKLPMAYALLITNQKAGGGGEDGGCERVASEGLREVPASFEIRVALMSCLKPRWGGTYEKMAQLAQSSQMLVRQNPRLAALKGFADAAYAETMNDQDQYALAVRYYTRALEKGGDYSWFYQGRADALARLDLHNEAIEDLRRADQLWPGDADTLVWLAYNFSAMNRNNEALKEINQAGEIAGLAPFGQRLRTTILSSLRQDDVEKLDFGD